MRGARISLSEASRSYNVATSSRAALRHHVSPCVPARCLSTQSHSSSDASSSMPPAFLQDLVNESLRPSFLFSALLAPAPKKRAEPAGSKSTSKSNQLKPTTAFQTEGSTATAAPTTSEATTSKMYNNRLHMIVRLIRLNRILSAMAAFTADVANPTRTPFTPQELEVLVVTMRLQIKKHATSRPAPKLNPATSEQHLWRPSRLHPSISTKSLSIPHQCMYAMATIYDVCLERNYQPTSKMVSAMLSTFHGQLSPEQLNQAAEKALEQLVPPTATEPDKYLRMISHGALASFLRAFGGVRRPDKGEALVARWAQAQRTNGKRPSLLHADDVIDLQGWASNIKVWQALIQGRVEAKDLAGARKWLDRYRQATLMANGATAPPALDHRPYLAYMVGVRNKLAPEPNGGQVLKLTSEIRDIVRLMINDHLPVESPVLAFVIGFEAQVGNVSAGASLIEELSSVIEANTLADASLLQALLQIRKAALDQTASLGSERLSKMPSTRSMIRSMIRIGEGDARTTRDDVAMVRSRGMLNQALTTAMAEHDYPAAIALLNLFERWRLSPSHTTYGIVLDALVAHGHHGVLTSDPAVTNASAAKLNLDATLTSMAREGNGEQAELIRRAVGEQGSVAGETIVVSAMPDGSLRQTQYLVRVLNRVCAAEIECMDSDRYRPEWLPSRGEEKDVGKQVRKIIHAAQDELLGPRESRRQLVYNYKRPLLTPGPSLSPRRRGFNYPGQRRADRAYSTSTSASAGTGAEAGEAASCDLGSAASKDLSHLEPVRAVYIPGLVPYSLGLALQEFLVKQRSDARAALRVLDSSASRSASVLSGHTAVSPSSSESALRSIAERDTLLLLQHRAVYTEGRREELENTLVSNHLRSLGADYFLTKRGGQITYHGPGQLVGYPILSLGAMALASRCYVDRVQDSLISLLAEKGVETVEPPEGHTGVWADEYHKIASIGIQVRHRVSSHGFALNVEAKAMQGFKHIVACGIVGRNMTSIQDRLNTEQNTQSVASDYTHHFRKVFNRRVREQLDKDEFVFAVDEHGVLQNVVVDGIKIA